MSGSGDCISRDAANEVCRECVRKYPNSFYNGIEAVRSELRNIPAADVRPRWIPFETRPMDEEERQYYSEQYGFVLTDDEAVIYCSEMPDHGQEVLVCNKYGMIWIDTFDDDPDYGVGFETNGDMDGLVAWMPLPKPYEPPKEE